MDEVHPRYPDEVQERVVRPERAERKYRREYSRGLGDTQKDSDNDEDEPIPEWVFSMLWWPVSILGFVLRVIGRFSKLAFLLAVSAATYFWIYSAMVPPSLSEHHPINFHYPVLQSEREGGVSANATVDFAFQRQLMLRSGARGMDWSSGMAPGSSLDVGVSLELPECQANYNVGTFTINVTVYDKQGQAVGQGRRSMVLRHKSSLLQTISTLVFSVPLIMALTSEHQTVSGTAVQLVSLPQGGLHSASLSLSDSRLQVYAASIDITFVLTGFRFYMFHWFLTSMAIGTIIISNLYVAAIGWLSQRIFGASFNVDEELGGARKHPTKSTPSHARSKRRHAKGKRREQAAHTEPQPEGCGPKAAAVEVAERRGASFGEPSSNDPKESPGGPSSPRQTGLTQAYEDLSGNSSKSSRSLTSVVDSRDSRDSRDASDVTSEDLDDSDTDWRTRKASDTSASAGLTRHANSAEESELWSASGSASIVLEPTTATSGDSGLSDDDCSMRRAQKQAMSARQPATQTPAVPALDVAAAAEGVESGVRRRHQSTLPDALPPDDNA